MRTRHRQGFTLIELSIVLVIIGLIVGGVLVGQDLIKAAEVRSTISQIEKYNTATNTFLGKYGALPGDITDPAATNFGFGPRGGIPGQGNGDGIIEGSWSWGWQPGSGEEAMFWADLSDAHLIEGTFTAASATAGPVADVTGEGIGAYLPQAKIGNGNYIYVWSGGYWNGATYLSTGINYFGIEGVTKLTAGDGKAAISTSNLTVSQAYAIDKKMDDGLPISGHVTAVYLVGDPTWLDGTDMLYSSPPTQTAPTATSCFDNGNVSNMVQHYSLAQNGGAGMSCALSFQFQ